MLVDYNNMGGIGSHGLSEISQAQRDKSITLQCETISLVRRVEETWVDKERKTEKLVALYVKGFLFRGDIVKKWQGGVGIGV